VLCIARCVCCGAELTCCCFKCCTCCCPSGGRSKKKHEYDHTPQPYDNSAYSSASLPAPSGAPIDSRPLNQQYRSHAAPTFNSTREPEPPQFARFDSPTKPVNGDALPAMPSWKDAKDVHVEEEVIPEKHDDMEMDRLGYNGSSMGTSMTAAAVLNAPRSSPRPGRSPVQRIQADDGYDYSQGYQNDAYATGPRDHSPVLQNSSYAPQQNGYRGLSPVHQTSPVYNAGAGYAQNQQDDRRSPAPGYSLPQYGVSHSTHSPPPLNTKGNFGYDESTVYHDPMEVSPLNPSATDYHNGYVATPVRSPSPGFTSSGPMRFEHPVPSASPAPAYPGQQTYGSSEVSYSDQPAYQAYAPGQAQGPQYSGVTRKAVEGSWKEV